MAEIGHASTVVNESVVDGKDESSSTKLPTLEFLSTGTQLHHRAERWHRPATQPAGRQANRLKGGDTSHLHNDHAGGLEDLIAAAPDLPVYVSREHWKAFGEHPFFASMEGATPNHWPKNFSPKIIDYEDRPVGPWKKSYPLTSDGKIVAVDTSGHVAGHLALLVFGENGTGEATTYVLPGDATYGIDVLDKEEPDGINDDPVRALQSLRLIKEFARQTDVVVLPSHDTNTPRFLAEGVVYRPK
ncbi:hypothetical protein V501_03803 [Pseudogymnoascus sp. VKM F-4519 (FW-2642)]|nr:hypothetical protein V501_03803 [Pseudogymnoascus sp. VKM F-4519 (FW-2642)]